MHLAKVLVTACTFFSVASAATYNVSVGKSGLTFDPPFISGVNSDDTILFQFPSSVSHSATESTFDAPCIPSLGTTRSRPIDSGIKTSSSSPPTYSAVIIDGSAPVWFFCKVGSHCWSGMVFAINPTSSQSFDAFKANAMGRSVTSGSSTPLRSASASASVSPTPASSGPGYGSSGVKTSVQKLTAGLAAVALLVGLS